jgi:tetratricopeptide (TPR) repeat protein
VALARNDARQAAEHFDRALETDARYVPALLGRGEALVALNRDADAAAAFEAAVAADPSLTDVARRVEVLKFRLAEQNLAAARQAARSGNLDEAARIYAGAIVRSPDSAFLYRELAAVERRKGELEAALADFRHAVMLDPMDAASLVQIGDILDSQGDFEDAVKTYNAALALEPNAEVEAKIENVQARAELARRPEEYRAIETAPEITRGDLAALIGVRLGPLVQSAPRRDGVVITDVRGHWAATWIMNVARAGFMEPYANHTFQPQTVVRRADLAQVVSRLLPRANRNAALVQQWQSSRLKFADLSAGHVAYPAASFAVASGVLAVTPDNTFQPSKPVSGAEAEAVMSRLESMAGIRSVESKARR